MNLTLFGGTSGKEPPCQCKRCKRCEFSLWVGKIYWRRTWPTHSNILAWGIPQTEEPGGLRCIGSQRVGHCLAHTSTFEGFDESRVSEKNKT